MDQIEMRTSKTNPHLRRARSTSSAHYVTDVAPGYDTLPAPSVPPLRLRAARPPAISDSPTRVKKAIAKLATRRRNRKGAMLTARRPFSTRPLSPFDWNEQFRLSLDPETAKLSRRNTPPRHLSIGPLLQHVRPQILLHENHGRHRQDGAAGELAVIEPSQA